MPITCDMSLFSTGVILAGTGFFGLLGYQL